MKLPIDNMCRTCLSSGGALISIFNDKSPIDRMLEAIASIQVSSSDCLPTKICISCVSEVNSAYSFRIKCENSEATLRQYLNEQFENEKNNIQITNNSTEEITNEDIICKAEDLLQQINFASSCNGSTTIQILSKIDGIVDDENEQLMLDDDKEDTHSVITTGRTETDIKFLEDEEEEEDEFMVKVDLKKTYDKRNSSLIYVTGDDGEDCEKVGYNENVNIVQENKILYKRNQNEEELQHFSISDKGIEEIQFDVELNKENEILKLEYDDCNKSTDNVDDDHASIVVENNDENTNNEIIKKSKVNKKDKSPVKCPYCPINFVHSKNLDRHVKKYHERNISNNQSKENCEKNTEEEKQTTKSSNELELLDSKIVIIDVQHNQQTLNAPFKCFSCGAGFAKEKSLTFHLKLNKCTEKQFGCSECKKVFIKKINLIEHIKTHSTFNCSQCLKSFSLQEDLDNHIEEKHNGLKKNKCPYCSKVFSMPCSLKDHLRIHSKERPYLCSLCGKAFSQNTNLRQHMMRHNKTKPFKCNQCDYSFVSKGELNSHMRRHTGDHPFVCDTCGGSFTTSSSLQKHRRQHTGERPYACEYCPMRFAGLSVLKNHRRTHTGEKPYICKFCDRSFAQKSDCDSHMRTHTGEKPYVCFICGFSFLQSGSLRTHMKSIHKTVYKKKNETKTQEVEQSLSK